MDDKRAMRCRIMESFQRKLVLISPEYRLLTVNKMVEEELGEDVSGEKCFEVFFGRSIPCKECPAAEVFTTGKPAARHFECIGKQDQKIKCLYSYPVFSDDGEVEGTAVMDFEVPALGVLEEKLRRSNAFLRNLILSSVDAVVAADKNGNILIFNESASEVMGYTEHEALTHLNIRDIYPDDGAFVVMDNLRSDEYGGAGKLISYRTDLMDKEGEKIPISLNASIVYEGDEEVATIGFFHDLRESLEMERELEKTQTQLLQAEKMASLGKLAAGVAHQLNNPLGGITLFTQLVLEDYELPGKAREDLERILKDAQRCRDTVKELLEFARQTKQEMNAHDLNKAVSRTLFLLENQTLFHNIEIERKLDPSIPQIKADIQQLNHLLMNIILNAAEAMEGRGRLSVETFPESGKGTVGLRIADTGPGIPEDVVPHIFEPFFTTKEPGKGTGLGLSLVYGIVENHGGRISTDSAPGEGTAFTISLPIADGNQTGGNSG